MAPIQRKRQTEPPPLGYKQKSIVQKKGRIE
ncbi:hypothetical protein CCACVL1_28818 [Corchorus capsularis]|uniref:Uncharacterized protein n=1 Tax=Corchorus capsularis TaxID=210143 RepID=A0A1R3G521_COCAP|nr:hypothetical protein CCACVL1_28818 [Corchorus capsularis]